MSAPEKLPWENYTPPDGQTRIDGTDELPLATNRPVDHRPRPKKPRDQTEQLFETTQEPKPEATPKTTRPVRGRLAMAADVNAGKREVENDLLATPMPELSDEDIVFGREQARRMADGESDPETS